MKKVQEIKKEELTELQDLVKNFNQHQLKLGELEIEKHQILHGASKIQEDLQRFQDGLRKLFDADLVCQLEWNGTQQFFRMF